MILELNEDWSELRTFFETDYKMRAERMEYEGVQFSFSHKKDGVLEYTEWDYCADEECEEDNDPDCSCEDAYIERAIRGVWFIYKREDT